uniref:tRNA pseudouridine(55) synthase n=1 Tax=Panagrolaimus superbus TaxID=310955 RepID=A0A914XWA3_9BILA
MAISLCSSCYTAISEHLQDTQESEEYYQCCLCFGLLDPSIYQKIIEKTKEEYAQNRFDGKNFVLAVNFPVSQLLRELFIQKIMDKTWNEMMMSPKSRLTYILMAKFRQDGFLRPSLTGDLTLTVTFENSEFVQRDTDFFMCHKPAGFLNAGNRKRKQIDEEEITGLLTKVKVQNLVEQLSLDIIKAFTFTSPTKSLDVTVEFQRDLLHIGGRYCKFSRSLPQSPWTPNHETPKILGNSVAEKVSQPMHEYFRCDSTKFIASGREDIDVRMLGQGRPFAIVLQNARKWVEMYSKETREKALKILKEKINAENKDIQVGDLAVVTQKETQLLNVGQEEKKKIYTALCYSHQKITEEMAKKLEAAMPVEINQLTPIRVLFRRPLLDRPRTIHAAKIQILDDHYFYLSVETQAGTYVKEFVHSDFGRTRPSVGTLLGFELTDGMSILELDVEGVDLEWPPCKKEVKAENGI